MKEHKIEIKTLTPLWTGDINQECSRVKETGIIGSLRWWYEALVRGLGGYACDPTEDDSCSLDYKKFKKDKEETSLQEALGQQICPACQLFGCTGWKKRFRLTISGFEKTKLFFLTDNKDWLKRVFEGNKYCFGGDGELKIIGDKETQKILLTLLYIIDEYGGLGAKTQNGFGQITIDEDITKELARQGLSIIINNIDSTTNNDGPNHYLNFKNFFSMMFRIPENNKLLQKIKKIKPLKNKPENFNNSYLPCAFDLRYEGSYDGNLVGLRNFLNKDEEKLLGKEGQASKIHISHPYKLKKEDSKYFLNIFGFVPNSVNIDVREKIKKYVQDKFCSAEIIFNKTSSDIIGDIK